MTSTPAKSDPDTPSWTVIAAMAVVCTAVAWDRGFTVAAADAMLPGIGIALLIAAIAFGRATGRARLAAGSVAFLQMTLFTITAVTLAYVLAAGAAPMWDERLMMADRWLGLNWLEVFRAADRHPAALMIGGVAYHSLVAQMVVAIVALSAAGRFGRLRATVLAAVLSGFVTILISGVMPAAGNLFDPDDYHALWASVAWMDRDLILGLRDGSVRELNLGHLTGIVSFPSYHATLPVILAWGLRDMPWLRVAAPIWATVTIVATPIFGGHYLVDVLGGLVLGGAAIAAVTAMAGRQGRSRSIRRTGDVGIAHGLG